MPNSLFNKFLGAESNPSHNPFDLSHRDVYSLKVGQLVPSSSALVLGDGTYKIDMQQVLRSDSLLSAAFTKMDFHAEWFFVPCNHLYHSFNQTIAQREDLQTSLGSSLEFPYFKFKYFLSRLLPYAIIDQLLDMCEFHTGIESDDIPDTWTFKDGSGTTRTLKWDESFLYKYYSLSSLFPNESASLNIIRNLDLYGYGNYLPFVKSFVSLFISGYNNIKYFESGTPTLLPLNLVDLYLEISTTFASLYASGDSLSSVWSFSSHELSDLMDDIFAALDITISSELNLNLWKPLAYNKIFGQVYRNPYYDFSWVITDNCNDGEYNYPYVNLFNLDDVNGELVSFDRLLCIFDTKYHQYHKDLFTGVLPNSQFGDVSVMVTDSEFHKLLVDRSNPSSSSPATVVVNNNDNKVSSVINGVRVSDFKFDPALAISILNQRKAEALQRFSENMLRAGNRTRDAFKAHFGYAPLSESKNDAMYLGSFDGDIELNTVAATDTNEFTQQGDLASYGVGLVRGNEITLHTNDFGILICIAYINKPAEYDNFGISRQNMMLDPFDYPYSEFQNVGLEPLDSRHLSYSLRGSFGRNYDERGVHSPTSLVGILGYLPSFIEFKTDFDKIHGEFYSTVPTLNAIDVLDFDIAQGDFSHMVTPRDSLTFADYKSWLYVNPNSVDNVFAEKVNGSQATDQFKCNCQFQIYGSLPLSVIGLPY